MKRVLALLLVVILSIGLCSAEEYVAYINPILGYAFYIPDGWIAVDYQNVADVLAANGGSDQYNQDITNWIGQMEGTPYVILFQKEYENASFYTNINVTMQNIGEELTVADLLLYNDQIKADLTNAFGNYTEIYPLTQIQLGSWDTALSQGEYDMYNQTRTLMQARFFKGTIMYEVTLTVLKDELTDLLQNNLGFIVGTFYAPDLTITEE